MCESIFGLLPIASEIDKRKLQLFGRLCLMDTKCLTKKIFLHRLFSYLDSPNCKHYGFIPDIIHLLDKYNLLEHLNSYLQNGLFLNKLEWKKTVNSAVFYHFTTFRSNRMLRDNDFTQFRHITGNSRPDWIWKLPSDVQEVTLCKFIVKLWTLQDLPPHICSLCQKLFTNIFEHVTTSCDGTYLFREAWWQTVIENFDINLSADLCGLSNNDLYLFLLGARSLPGLSFIDFSYSLHLLNFRLIRDAAACYYRMSRVTSCPYT